MRCPGLGAAGEPLPGGRRSARVPMTRILSSSTPRSSPSQQGGALVVGDDHGAVGGPHVGGQRLAPPGRVDARPWPRRPARRRSARRGTRRRWAAARRCAACRRRTASGPGRPAWRPRCTASRQVQRSSPSMTPVRSSSARAASMAATVVTAGPIPACGAPGCGRCRRRCRRRRGPWCAAARTRTSAAVRPRPSAPPVATAHSDGRPTRVARAPSASAFTTSGARRTPPST